MKIDVRYAPGEFTEFSAQCVYTDARAALRGTGQWNWGYYYPLLPYYYTNTDTGRRCTFSSVRMTR